MEYPPIFEAGMHSINQSDMKGIFVLPFKNPEKREYLLSRFESFLEKLREFPIEMEIWVDGSFVTEKENPGDIDLVVVCQNEAVNSLPDDKQEGLIQLFRNNAETKLRYECDAYFILDDMHDKSYWRGLFGFDRNEVPKGIPRLKIGAEA